MPKNHYVNNRLLGTVPTNPNDYVTMSWVEEFTLGKIKGPVRALATDNIAGTMTPGVAPNPAAKATFTLTTPGFLTVDSVPTIPGDRLLFIGQTNGAENGIWEVVNNATLVRPQDFDDNNDVWEGQRVYVISGTNFGGTVWKLNTPNPITLGTTPLQFIPAPYISAATQKSVMTITGDGIITDFNVNHALDQTGIIAQVFDIPTNEEVGVGITALDANNVTISFDNPPAAGKQYRVVVIG